MDQSFIDLVYEGFEYERSRSKPPEKFPALPVIPGGRYTDSEFLELEQQFLWQKSWVYACHQDELPQKGSYILWDKTHSPILIVRGLDDQVRAFYNTCRHRGSPLVTASSGKVSTGLRCIYHGWNYDLEGNLRGVPERRDFSDLELDCLGLVKVRCERLGNWIFINQDPEAEPLLKTLGPIASQLQPFEPQSIRHVESYGFDVECSIKIMLEAFFEVYHLKNIHQDTVNRFLEHRATKILLWPNGHSLMVTPNRNPEWVDPGTIGMLEFPQAGELPLRTNVSYNVFPNLVTPVAPTGMPFLTFWPSSTRTMRIDCHWFAPDWGDGDRHPLWEQRIENFNRILQEDLDLAPQIQRSMESPGFLGTRVNYQERRIYHWHEELDRRIGIDRVPDHLRIAPRLSGMIERN
jgi:phenylpropionate dioxygenase-like ring-hydroxylating dioxygenase large terminal subunit